MTVEHSATYVLSMELHLSPRLPLERVHLLACYDRLLERILSPHSKSHTIPIFGEIMIDPLIHRSVTQRLPNPSLYPIQKIERHPSCPEQTSVQIPPPQRLEQSVAPATNEQVQLQRWWIPWIYWNLRPCSSSLNPLLKVAWQEPQLSSRMGSSTESCSGSQRWNWLNTGTGSWTEALKRAACLHGHRIRAPTVTP